MHMTMRKYRQIKGTPEAAIVWVKKKLMPVLKNSKGFKAYYAVAFDDGTIGSINVFESEDAANHGEAIKCFQRALEHDPQCIIPCLYLGNTSPVLARARRGPAPRVRGTHHQSRGRHQAQRFSPARAGNTRSPVASGWSGCRVGLAPTRKAPHFTAHVGSRHSP
jgi:hypothetical protein